MGNGITLDAEVARSMEKIESNKALKIKVDRFLKRYAIDIPLATVGLIATSPLIALSLAAIKLDSKGPAIYREKRLGEGGKEFTLYKMRTLKRTDYHNDYTLDSYRHLFQEKLDGITDSRATRVGKFLRRTKIDELPQLLNVLKGDMSIVGPRPTTKGYFEALNYGQEKISCPPGITGLSQVNIAKRGKIKYDRSYDKLYVRRYQNGNAFLTDLYTILRTPIAIARRHTTN